MSHLPALIEKELPAPPKLGRAFGVGIVVMGMAMGTGELIMWPHLSVKYGLGLLWLALIGILFQYIINQEVARHALATGESFFTSASRFIFWAPFFWLPAAILLYVWPGWASALGTILAALFGFGHYVFWAWISLTLVLILIWRGKIAYHLLERSLKIVVPIFILLLFLVSFINLNWTDLKAVGAGLVNFGYLPAGVDLAVLLGAVVFAGAGGMLNLCVSLWYRDKGLGMGHYAGRIANPITGEPEAVAVSGYTFALTKENLKNWRSWLWYLRFDQGLIFALLGLVSLVLLSANAVAVLGPLGLVPQGVEVATAQAEIFRLNWGWFGGKLYLLMAYLMLFAVMWTVLDALTRMVADLIHTNAQAGRLTATFRWFNKISIHHLYYALITIFIFIQAILLPFNQPLGFLVISSVLGAITMAIYTPLLFYLNNWRLPPSLRPGWLSNFLLLAAAIFYSYFSILIVLSYF